MSEAPTLNLSLEIQLHVLIEDFLPGCVSGNSDYVWDF